MDKTERLTKSLVKIKSLGHLKAEYQAMTDEEFVANFLSRVEKRRAGKPSANQTETPQEK